MFISGIQIGTIVTFNYRGTIVHDKFPQVLVLHNNWRGCVHGLNLNYLSQMEIDYIKGVLNPTFAQQISQRNGLIKIQLARVANISSLNINSPWDFYVRFVRGFIRPRKWDPYRRYSTKGIIAPKVIIRKDQLLGKISNEAQNSLNRLGTFRG